MEGMNAMRLWIDADACPVTDIAIRLAKAAAVPVTLVCDDAHRMERDGADTLMVLRGADSADFALVNRLQPGDAVVTQDYGLAAMCLARGAQVMHQDGYFYNESNIDSLLSMRHIAKKVRRAGGRTRGPAKRTAMQDEAFRQALEGLLSSAAAAPGGSPPLAPNLRK